MVVAAAGGIVMYALSHEAGAEADVTGAAMQYPRLGLDVLGEGYGVSLEQVKRARETWFDSAILLACGRLDRVCGTWCALSGILTGAMRSARRSAASRSGCCLRMGVWKRWPIASRTSMMANNRQMGPGIFG